MTDSRDEILNAELPGGGGRVKVEAGAPGAHYLDATAAAIQSHEVSSRLPPDAISARSLAHPWICNTLHAMPKRRPDNTLSRRTINCLSKAGIPIERQAIIRALRSGKMFPYFWPPNYGKCTHREVCRWAGIDPATLPKHPPAHEITPYVDDGLSFRAHNCLKTAGVARTKEAVLHALQTGVLSPSRCPAGYGKVTHTEVCRWIGLRRPVILDVPYERRLCG